MSTVIKAIYIDGVLKPEEKLDLAEGAAVRLVVDTWPEAQAQAQAAFAALDELCEELPIDSHGQRLTRDELHERR